ncbi:MAG: transcriptional repressor LexA [Bacillota bacterium]
MRIINDDLTSREQQILSFIIRHIKEKGYPPTVREIGEAVGLKSSSTAYGYVKKLENKGILRTDPDKPRAMEVVGYQFDVYAENNSIKKVPVLGKVAAGEPILATEIYEDTLSLPVTLFGDGELFSLTVKGDSMIEAGINEGDRVVVRQQLVANNGDIVVAIIEGEATVKRFYREKGYIRLQPENSAYEPIISRNVTLAGKVVGLLRKY